MPLTRRFILKTGFSLAMSSFIAPLYADVTDKRAADKKLEPIETALWGDTPPGGGGPKGNINKKHGAVHNIARPLLKTYVPMQPNGSAVLIAAGGGYKRIEIEKEAMAAVRWCNGKGIIASVLYYRLPDEDWPLHALAPLQDAQRALKLMASGTIHAALDKNRIMFFGFSAGGHLMGMTAARPYFNAYQPIDVYDALIVRPVANILAYPVITLMPPYDKTSTRRVLVGKTPTPSESKAWSVETYVDKDCPPTFLVQAKDDAISNPQNTAIMEAACQKAGVTVEHHLLASGGHGFAMGKAGTASADWPNLLEKWLKKNNLLAD